MRILPVLLLACVLPLASVHAEEAAPTKTPTPALPTAKPADVGLSAERLAGIADVVKPLIEKKAIAGAVTVVARKGKVAYSEAFGAFEKDSLFRIYSMTKPVTVAAALMLVDDGSLKLDEPVATYLPAFKHPKVEGKEGEVAPITVRQLMMHTAGFSYGFFGNTPVDQAYRKARLLGRNRSLAEMSTELSKIPLLFEPGGRWHYSVSIDLLGRLIEVVAKKPFDVFLRERLFTPLGMVDTAFHVPPEKVDRFVPNYGMGGIVVDRPKTSAFLTKPAFLSGGGGLISTARDYTIFALMLASGGTWNGKRYLKAETVREMTVNHLPDELMPIRFGAVPLVGLGFGLGVSVRVKGTMPGMSVGEWGWAGAASTTFFVAPKEELVMISMTQRMPMWNGLDRALRPVVFGAIEQAKPATAK